MSRVSGFHKARPGKIHMRCPKCGRKQSNMDRSAEHDHPTAYLMELLCDACGMGCKDDAPTYYTRQNRVIDYWRWWEKRERERDRMAESARGGA
jgi:hypothetical protein